MPSVHDTTVWTKIETFAVAEPPSDTLEIVDRLLTNRGLERHGRCVLMRHRPGDRGLIAPQDDVFGFLLDLSEARRTADGGLLLFVSEDDRAIGWRAQAGMMTIWPADMTPDISELAIGASERISLMGSASPV